MATSEDGNEYWFEEQIVREDREDKRRRQYSMVEDVKLEHYVKEVSRRARMRGRPPPSTKGDSFWKQAERDCVLPGRSWQSMKEHWKKFIKPQIRERYRRLREQGLVRPVEEEDSSVYSDTSSESERVLSFDAEPVEVSSGESDGEPVDEVGNQLGSNPKKGPADAAEEGREGGKREGER
ncbi:hypothetical protein FOZ60_001344 [Perkinsus olseni]|uniref:TERF2-interacting telomeric protein 1 Myb domain-containing protein n=1 Tax=Perkinsus olseni TaxID=32597 RepID=A0A7J6P0L8_PEROL|nr:hypothetical protein FOZ60_001344 [Perkinsus olseni]